VSVSVSVSVSVCIVWCVEGWRAGVGGWVGGWVGVVVQLGEFNDAKQRVEGELPIPFLFTTCDLILITLIR